MIKPVSRLPRSSRNTPWSTSNTTNVQIYFGTAISHDHELTIVPPCPPFARLGKEKNESALYISVELYGENEGDVDGFRREEKLYGSD